MFNSSKNPEPPGLGFKARHVAHVQHGKVSRHVLAWWQPLVDLLLGLGCHAYVWSEVEHARFASSIRSSSPRPAAMGAPPSPPNPTPDPPGAPARTTSATLVGSSPPIAKHGC